MRLLRFVACVAMALACSDAGPKGTLYHGTFSGPFVETFTLSSGGTCVITFALSGTVDVRLTGIVGEASGRGDVVWKESAGTASNSFCAPQATDRKLELSGALTGTVADMHFAAQQTVNGAVVTKGSVAFSGSLQSEGTINGTLTLTWIEGPHPSGMTGLATTTIGVVLR